MCMRAAASVIVSGNTCPYVFMVVAIWLCPRISMTVRGWTPLAISSVAAEWRRSWKRIVAGSPALSRIAFHARTTLRASKRGPVGGRKDVRGGARYRAQHVGLGLVVVAHGGGGLAR